MTRLATVGIEALELSPLRRDRAVPKPSARALAGLHEHGLVMPPLVRPSGARRYEILRGAVEWIAVQQAGRRTLPVVIEEDLSDEEAERIVNGDGPLDPITAAEQLRALRQTPGASRSVTELARVLGRDRSALAHALRLLALPLEVREQIRDGALSAGHGKVLLAVRSRAEQTRLAAAAVRGRWSVRRLERERRGETLSTATADTAPHVDPDVARLEQRLSAVIGSPVSLDTDTGTLAIRYGTNAVLVGVLERLLGADAGRRRGGYTEW